MRLRLFRVYTGSRLISDREYREAEKHLDHIVEAWTKYGPDDDSTLSAWFPYILLGIGSRESRWGIALDSHGTGDYGRRSWGDYGALPADGMGWGRGIMQIDYAAHEFARTGLWRDPQANILYGAKVLRGCYRVMQSKRLEDPILTRAAIASYNRGPGNIWRDIQQGFPVDSKTAHGNYSMDVLKRATSFRRRVELDLSPVMDPREKKMQPKPLADLDENGDLKVPQVL